MNGFAEDNATAYETPLDKAAFLRCVQGREGRYELKGNCVVMLTGGTRNHARIAQRIASLPSLQAYIVASQEEPIVWVWQRDPATGAFTNHPVEIAGRDAAVKVTALDVSLSLSKIFRDIGTVG